MAKAQAASVVTLVVLLALLEVGTASAMEDTLNVAASGGYRWWLSSLVGNWVTKASWESLL